METICTVTDERKTTKVRDIKVGKACIAYGKIYIRVAYAASTTLLGGIVKENHFPFVRFPEGEIVAFVDCNIPVIPINLELSATILDGTC